MLYSICSMPFWINKSNLVCADKGWSLVSVIWLLFLGKLDPLNQEKCVPKLEFETPWLVWVVGGDLDTRKGP